MTLSSVDPNLCVFVSDPKNDNFDQRDLGFVNNFQSCVGVVAVVKVHHAVQGSFVIRIVPCRGIPFRSRIRLVKFASNQIESNGHSMHK